ncbi:NUDIX domain-containing protein [uncultured Acetatifactor sp.]|uniref:NUDIX domain-containing protein n=1 Tax=uncultured Acetatifactor sp. TaxID=1671927 RepID=UPI0026399CA6|nr:NUDIX domain-containing protein [uncultured Acetatifactor sp.]
MDIGYETSNMKFSLRSAALIFKNDCALLVKSDYHHCFYTVGGGIQENETSESAVIRECYEETSYHFEIDRLVFIEERLQFLDWGNDDAKTVVSPVQQEEKSAQGKSGQNESSKRNKSWQACRQERGAFDWALDISISIH